MTEATEVGRLAMWRALLAAAAQGGYARQIHCSPQPPHWLYEGYTRPIDDAAILFDHAFARALWGNVLCCYDCGEEVGPPLTAPGIQIGTGTCTCSRQFENNLPRWEMEMEQLVGYLPEDRVLRLYRAYTISGPGAPEEDGKGAPPPDGPTGAR